MLSHRLNAKMADEHTHAPSETSPSDDRWGGLLTAIDELEARLRAPTADAPSAQRQADEAAEALADVSTQLAEATVADPPDIGLGEQAATPGAEPQPDRVDDAERLEVLRHTEERLMKLQQELGDRIAAAPRVGQVEPVSDPETNNSGHEATPSPPRGEAAPPPPPHPPAQAREAAAREPDNEQLFVLLGSLRRHAIPIIVLTLLCAAAAGLFSASRPQKYAVSSLILFDRSTPELQLLGGQGGGGGGASDDQRAVANSAALLDSPDVAVATARALGGRLTEKKVEDAVDVQAESDADVVKVSGTGKTRADAVTLVNTYANTFRRLQVREQARQAGRARVVLTQRLAALSPRAASGLEGQTLSTRIAQLRALERVGTGSPRIIDPAQLGEATQTGGFSGPLTLLGAFLGLALGLGVALVREQVDRRLRRPTEMEAALGAPVLAGVPRSRALRRNTPFLELRDAEAEPFRILAAKLGLGPDAGRATSLLVTSARDGEGKTTIAWYLASAFAATGVHAVLVEADHRQPALAARHGLDLARGVLQVQENQSDLAGAVQQVPIGTPAGHDQPVMLDVLASGASPSQVGEVNPGRVPSIVEDLRDRYEVVIVDSAPLIQVADTIPLARKTDGVLVVTRVGLTGIERAENVRRQIADLGGRILGVVANGDRRGQGYQYQKSRTRATRRRRGRA